MSIFENIVDATEIEEYVRDVLAAWFPTYLRELEIQKGLTTPLPVPVSYTVAEDLDLQQGPRFPSVVVLSPGLNGRPHQEGNGSFRAWFSVAVGVIVAANNRENTKKLVRRYTAVARAIMIQKLGQEDGPIQGVSWLDESYDDNLPFTDEQTLSAGQTIFEVEAVGVVSRWGGPLSDAPPDPVTQPGSEWLTVATVIPSVEVKE